MDLIIDIGNTQTKVAFFENGIMHSKFECEDQQLVAKLKDKLPFVERVLLSSVKSVEQHVYSAIESGVCVFHQLTSKSPLPFKWSYDPPEAIGHDRLALAAAAVAFRPKKNVLVIDLGTCITYDFVDNKRCYHGGAISPGLEMRLKALNHYTATLPLITLSEPSQFIGNSTKSSILSGVVNGTLMELNGIIEDYKKRYQDIEVVLTGGNVKLFENKLKSSIFAEADFLLKGMHFILQTYAHKKI
jgi:type III pantothenate kinase